MADPLFDEGNRTLYVAILGIATANGDGEINVYIDNNTSSSNSERAWYDGVGYEVIPEPASLALLGLGGLMIARRR